MSLLNALGVISVLLVVYLIGHLHGAAAERRSRESRG